jgi:hypothetical protein
VSWNSSTSPVGIEAYVVPSFAFRLDGGDDGDCHPDASEYESRWLKHCMALTAIFVTDVDVIRSSSADPESLSWTTVYLLSIMATLYLEFEGQ